jgi:mannosyltransferase
VSVGTLAQELRDDGARPRSLSDRVSDQVAIVAGLTALAAVLRFAAIGHQGFWYDEASTALLVHFGPIKMLRVIPARESTPPLYYALAWIWAHVFGSSEAGLRSLSALAGTATVPAIYAAGSRLISGRAGVVAAALAACNPLLIWYSQEARAYALLVLLTALTVWAFANARAQPTPRRLALWALLAALALLTHYYAVLAVVPEAVWLLAAGRRERRVQIAVGAAALVGLALVPLAIRQAGTGHSNWIAAIALGGRLGQVPPQFLIGFGAPAAGWTALAGVIVVAGAVALLVWRADLDERRGAVVAATIAAGGIVLELLLIAGGIDDMITRNVLALWVPVALVLAAGLGARRAGVLGLAGAAVLCATGIVAAVGVMSERDLQRPDWRGPARALGPRPTAGAGAGRAILVQHYRELLPLSLYVPGLESFPRRGSRVSELDVISIAAPRVRLCWWGAACNLTGSHLQSAYPIPGFRIVSRTQAFQFTVLRMVTATPVRLTSQMVSRALTTTSLHRDELLLQPPG